jgi:hypothetical protein
VVDRDLRQDDCLGGRAGPVTSQAAMMEQSINFPSSTSRQEGRKNTGPNSTTAALVFTGTLRFIISKAVVLINRLTIKCTNMLEFLIPPSQFRSLFHIGL